MRKAISLFLATFLLICITIPVSVYAEETPIVSISTENGVDFAQLQRLFPDIALKEDGFIEDYSNNISSYSNSQEKQLTETYTADYVNGSCKLYVYSDGSYMAAGCEKIETNQNQRSYDYGSTATGNGYYRSYLSLGTPQMSYTYKVTNKSGTNLYQITNLGNMQFNGSVGIQLVGKGLSTVRSLQTTTNPAEVYGDVAMYQVLSTSNGVNSVYNCTYRLTTKVSYANITVSVSTYI